MKTATDVIQGHYNSPLGPVVLAARHGHMVGVWFVDQHHLPVTVNWSSAPEDALLQRARRQLDEYFAGQRQQFDLPLDLSTGSAFQQAVWRALLAIPFGVSSSYGAVSAVIGRPSAVRAVGGAIGRNPLGIVVPCHRVIGANGSLTGYAGGLERKTALLKLEGLL
jgi:methylated-DNA-[protein]-cysteine S-methyltransferase